MEDGRGLWTYRMSCESCLAIVRVERPEMDASGRALQPPPIVDVTGAVVARALDRLREAERAGELRAEVARLSGGAEERVLLRIPEVLAVARAAWGGWAVFTRPAAFSIASVPASGDAPGAVEGVEVSPDLLAGFDVDRIPRPAGVRVDERIVLVPGSRFEVSGTDTGRMRLVPGSVHVDGALLEILWAGSFLVHADLLAPGSEPP